MEEPHLLSQGYQIGDSTHPFHSQSFGENLAKHPPLIARGGWQCRPPLDDHISNHRLLG